MFREKPTFKESVDVLPGIEAQDQALDQALPACVPVEGGNLAHQSTIESNLAHSVNAAMASGAGNGALYTGAGNGALFSGAGNAAEDKHPVWSWCSQRLAIASIALASFLSYFAVHLVAANYYWRLTDVQTSEFMHSTVDGSSLGVFLCFLCTIRLMRALSGIKEPLWLTLFRACVAASALFAAGVNYGAGGVAAIVLCIIAYLGIGKLGGYIRQAVPSTFRFARAVKFAGLASIPTAALTCVAFYQAITSIRPHNTPSVYFDHTGGELAALVIFMSFLIAVPTYVIARNARTSEAKPLIALGLLVQIPILLGFTAQTAIAAFGSNPVQMTVAIAGALLTTAAISAAGAAAGAKVNGIRHRRKMMASGSSTF